MSDRWLLSSLMLDESCRGRAAITHDRHPLLDTLINFRDKYDVDAPDFHWLVGILEGEGTFLCAPPASPGQPVVRVSMTDRDTVERVAALLGRAVLALRKRDPRHKQPFATTIRGAPAVELMRAVRPYMGIARQSEIDRALASYHSVRIRLRNPPMICSAVGCPTGSSRRGLCRRHYNSWWKATRSGREPKVEPILQRNEYSLEAHDTCDAACEIMWLAGLLDGEGCFTMTKDDSNTYPVISIEMTDRDIIERAATLLAAPRVRRVEPDEPGWSVTYHTSVSGHTAAQWMRKLRSLMSQRRAAAIDAALSAYRPIRLVQPPSICVVAGCVGQHRGRGLCHKHYMTWTRDRVRGRQQRVTPLR